MSKCTRCPERLTDNPCRVCGEEPASRARVLEDEILARVRYQEAASRARQFWTLGVTSGRTHSSTPNTIAASMVSTARSPYDQCARCWVRGDGPCQVCNYPLPRTDLAPRQFRGRLGSYPEDTSKRERLARNLVKTSLTSGALDHYLGVYWRAVPE